MLDMVVWTAIFVALSFGILLICIELHEEWKYPIGDVQDLTEESPTVQLKRLARQLGKMQMRNGQTS